MTTDPLAPDHAVAERAAGDDRAQQLDAVLQGPLSLAQLSEVSAAGQRVQLLRRALRLARINGISLCVLVVLVLPIALFDPLSLMMALLLGASGFAELYGAQLLKALDPRAPRWLMSNQLALLFVMVAYCAFKLYDTWTMSSDAGLLHTSLPALGGSSGGPGLDDMVRGMANMVDSLLQTVFLIAYSLVLGLSVVYQGGCAVYYASREPLLTAHRSNTPAWLREVERRLNAW